VETLGGRMRVDTVPGAGTTIEAIIPLDPANAATRWPSHGTGSAGA
jgi:signal transduction histidine kinase